ncbi:hypothetical protein ACIA49_28310 [Kribbella sp. NPDC051587]|uniref:hypothetical protein n=1 Tax=Kribbella sp. NPDC051587 TaxID=3364119 RepID=UPI003788B75F
MRLWALGLGAGLLYGVLFGLAIHYLEAESWKSAVVAAVITGPPLGVTMVLLQRRWGALIPSIDTNLTREQRRTAFQASRRGPVPTDPAIRAAALVAARRQLDRYRSRLFRVFLFVMPVFLVLSGVLTLLDDDREKWRAILPLAGAVLLSWSAFEPRRLRRRVKLLSTPDST